MGERVVQGESKILMWAKFLSLQKKIASKPRRGGNWVSKIPRKFPPKIGVWIRSMVMVEFLGHRIFSQFFWWSCKLVGSEWMKYLTPISQEKTLPQTAWPGRIPSKTHLNPEFFEIHQPRVDFTVLYQTGTVGIIIPIAKKFFSARCLLNVHKTEVSVGCGNPAWQKWFVPPNGGRLLVGWIRKNQWGTIRARQDQGPYCHAKLLG